MATYDTDSQMHAAAYIAAGAPKLPRARDTPTSYVTSSPSIRASFDVTKDVEKREEGGFTAKKISLIDPHTAAAS